MTDHNREPRSFTENLEVAGDKLVNTVKALFDDAGAKRVTIRTQDGKELLSLPLTLGIAGGAAAVLLTPMLALLAAVGGAFAKLKLEVERNDS